MGEFLKSRHGCIPHRTPSWIRAGTRYNHSTRQRSHWKSKLKGQKRDPRGPIQTPEEWAQVSKELDSKELETKKTNKLTKK